MKNKNIYDLLNDGKFKEPEKLEEVTVEEVEKYKAAFLKNNVVKKKKSLIMPKIAVAAALLIGFISFTPPGQIVYGKIIEFYENMINPISEYSIDPKKTDESITRVDKEIISNGIKFTLKDVMADGDTLYLNMYYEVLDENIIKEFGEDKTIGTMPENDLLLLNGKEISWKQMGTVKGTIVDNKTNQQYFQIQFLDDLKEGDVVTLKQEAMRVNEINLEDPFNMDFKRVDISGDWTVDIPITVKDEKLNTITKTIDKEIYNIEGVPIIFESIRINAFRSIIKLSYKDNAKQFISNSIFIATDENGVEYTFDSGFTGDEVKDLKYFGEEGKNISKVKTLTFQGYQVENKEEKALIPFGESFTIEF